MDFGSNPKDLKILIFLDREKYLAIGL